MTFLRSECKCVACGRTDLIARRFFQGLYIIDPAHGPVNGMRSKGPDDQAIPLCRIHHEQQTRLGWKAFEEMYGFDRAKEAAAHYKLYEIWKETTGVSE